MQKLKSINPSNYQILGLVNCSTPREITDKVKLARNVQHEWRDQGIVKRVSLLRRIFDEFKKRKSELILLECREVGMPISNAFEDFEDTFDYINWSLDNAEKYLNPETTFENDTEIHQLFHEPIGVSGIIIPWNFPLANFVWASLQSLIAGNTVVLKHSEECPLSGKFIENILSHHLPQGVFNEIYGDGETGKLLIQQEINLVTFTGSTKTGKSIYKTAGKKFIKTVMELGGSAPGLIFDDADIEFSVKSICNLRLFNTGQCCDGLKRLIVQEGIFNKLVENVSSIFSSKKIGNAEEESTEVGPLVAKRQLELLIAQVEDAKGKGAQAVTGGNSLEPKMGGAFFEPTVLTAITKDMRVWKEEVFGPVLPIVKFKTDEEAIELANQTTYGLGAYIFTRNTKRADNIASLIEAGMVSINNTNYKIPSNPFGGYKNSGFGRINGKYGFHEVTQLKIIAKNK
ncbi:MAG: aldehyde dehydrogenase family protein [Candidatus Gottesmanbacteria bacterium]